jgi:hypothetical protein
MEDEFTNMLKQLESQIETSLKPREPKCTNFMEEYLEYTNSNIEKLTGINLNLRKLMQRTSQTIKYGYESIKEKERQVNDVEHEIDERTQRINFLITEKEILTSQSEAEKMTLIDKHNEELAQQKTNYEEQLAIVEKLESINFKLRMSNSYDLTAKARLEDEKIALRKEYEEKLALKDKYMMEQIDEAQLKLSLLTSKNEIEKEMREQAVKTTTSYRNILEKLTKSRNQQNELSFENVVTELKDDIESKETEIQKLNEMRSMSAEELSALKIQNSEELVKSTDEITALQEKNLALEKKIELLTTIVSNGTSAMKRIIILIQSFNDTESTKSKELGDEIKKQIQTETKLLTDIHNQLKSDVRRLKT